MYRLVKIIYHKFQDLYLNVIHFHFPYLWCKYRYKFELGKSTNFDNPKDINEKIQWLSFFTDTTKWSMLADKYAVRQYVAEKVGEHILVPLLGKWDNAKDIDFNLLPEKFVIKPNNGSYDTMIIKEKSKADLNKIRKNMEYSMKHRFGYENAEVHYLRIKPCIIAEQMLEADEKEGLIDYKIWCFDGKPYMFFVISNRDNIQHTANFNCYDLQWQRHPEFISPEYRNNLSCPRPENINEMLLYASKLSQGLPQARIDLYNLKGKIYFGEITLTSNYGMMPYFTQEMLDNMGKLCILPKRSFKEKFLTFYRRWSPYF